jgi:DNA-binding transcriptional LysR family regulator
MDQIARHAPRVGLDVTHLSPLQTIDALEKDEVDAAVSMGLEHTGTIRRQVLFDDRMVCFMRRSHPLAKGKLTLERFLAARHLKVSMSPMDSRFVDDVLSGMKSRRDVALNVPHWLLVPRVLGSSDYISVVPGTFACAISDETLVSRALPFASKPFEWCLYWHRRHDDNPANRWLRDLVTAAGRQIGPG